MLGSHDFYDKLKSSSSTIFFAISDTSLSHTLFKCKSSIKDYYFFKSVLRPFQDYFSSYETGQSVGGAKTGEPREKPLDTPASRTWLVSRVARAGLEPTPVTAVS